MACSTFFCVCFSRPIHFSPKSEGIFLKTSSLTTEINQAALMLGFSRLADFQNRLYSLQSPQATIPTSNGLSRVDERHQGKLRTPAKDLWINVSSYLPESSGAVVVIHGYWVGPDNEDGWGYIDATIYQAFHLCETYDGMGKHNTFKRPHITYSMLLSFAQSMAEPKIILWEDGWGTIQEGFAKLVQLVDGKHSDPFSSDEYMKYYTVTYNMCVQRPPYDYTGKLYDNYKILIEGYMTSTVLPLLEKQHEVFFLRELEKRWLNHKNILVRWLSHFLSYINRFHIVRRSLPTLKQAGFNSFRAKVYEKVKGKAKEVILSLINQEREGDQIDRTAVKNVLSMFVELGVQAEPLKLYQTDFETFMLENTDAHYSRKASKHVSENTCAEYLFMAEECLRREKDRATYYLDASSESKLLEKTQHQLLYVHAKQILEKESSGLHVLLRDNKEEDLSRMFRLYSKIDKGLELISAIFKEHVSSVGLALIKEAADGTRDKKVENRGNAGLQEKVFVNKVIELHDKYLNHCNNCFMGNSLFHKALKEGFEAFLNKEIAGASIAELLSTFCDSFLQKGSEVEKLGEDVIEETIEKVVRLVAYIHEKDLFAEFSRKKLARRLLSDRSANIEHEKRLLSKLKQQFGTYFTSKMEGMVTDLTLARDLQLEFKNYIRDNPNETGGVDFSVTVLTTGFWPTYKSVDFNFPGEFFVCIDAFKTFYNCKTNQRKLNWIFSQGSCHLAGNFKKKKIELNLSTYQAATLLLFNTEERITFKEISNELKLPIEEMKRVLHSLSCGKYKILLKEPENNRIISADDVFVFNENFTDRMARIKIPLPNLEEKKKVIEDVDKERKYTIDAALVRIMKSRKVLGHQELVRECIEMLNRMFKPDVKIIKRRIEDLVGRDYLTRDEENANAYKYVA